MSVKITELPILSELADNDVIAGVDVSGNVTSKIEMETLKGYIDTNTQYTAGTNIDITNNVISAPDVPTKEEFDSLSTIFNAFPTESDEDESMTLDGTAEVKFKKFDLEGNTSQTTYSGKNLLINIRDEGYTVTSNGITFKVNADKSITVSGTATSVASMALNTGVPVTLSAGTYTLSKKETTDVQVAIWYDSASVWTAVRGDVNTIQKTISENTTFNNWRTLVVVYQGVTVNTTIYPMLEKSSTETSYEPYTGGNPSPNPSYPQDIHVVSGDNEIEVCGKNICFTDFGDWKSGEYNSSGDKGNNTSRVRIKDLLIVRQSTTYYFDTSSSNDSFIVREYDKNKTFIKSDGIIANGGTITTMSSCYFLGITLFSNTNQTRSYDTYQTLFEESSIKPFICLNSVSNKTYEPYIGNTYNIDLPSGMELCKIGNYQDYIYKDSDKWYLHKEIGKVVFTGGSDETWDISETNTSGNNRFINVSIANLVVKPSADSVVMSTLSNYFVPKSANQTYSRQEGLDISRNGNIHVYADSTKTYTVAQFKTWLSTHNTIVYYPLATPTNTEITDTTLISQLNAIKLATSKQGQTNISQENNDKPFIIDAEAIKDLSSVLDRIELLES